MRKILSSILMVIVMLSMVVISGDSMRHGHIDATWGYVDGTISDPRNQYTFGANCLRYADGPPGSFENPEDIYDRATNTWRVVTRRDFPSVQDIKTTNWNQVRYGTPDSDRFKVNNCWDNANDFYQAQHFYYQSGLAFKGIQAVNPIENRTDYGELAPFPLGKMCHINKPIRVMDKNNFNTTYASLVISEVDCGPDATVVDNEKGDPLPGGATTTTLNHTFVIVYDETVNYPSIGPCPYGDTSPCADAMIPKQTQGNKLYCKQADDTVLSYSLALLGFTTVDVNDACTTYNPNLRTDGIFISDENSTNCSCVWAVLTQAIPLIVEMNFFEASAGEQSIVLRWQTAFETDNIGFNVYRSETLIREDAVQLNQELIASLVPPGSTFGADYEFIDNSALPYTTYFYWIEDVDVNGTITTHGPVRAEWVD